MALLPRLKARLGTLFASADDPRDAAVSVYRHQVELLERLEVVLAEVSASKSQLQSQADRMREQLPRLEQQARSALLADREDIARLALTRRREATAELRRVEGQVADVAQEEERLELARQRLGAQIERLRARQEALAARYTAAEAQVRINEALAGISQDLSGLGTALDQAEARTERMQARASAIDELMQAGSLGHEAQDAEMLDPEEAAAVDRDLEALKREVVGQPAER